MAGKHYIRLAIEGSWVFIGHGVSVIGSLVLVRVLTEYLAPEQYGQLSLGLTLSLLVNQIMMGGIAAGIGRHYSIAIEKQSVPEYLQASKKLLAYATFVVSMIGILMMSGLVLAGYSQWMGLAASALVVSVIAGYNLSLSSIQNAARQRAIVAFHSGLDAWLKILLTVGVMIWFENSSTAVLLSYALSSLLVTGSQFLFLRRLIPNQNIADRNSNQWVKKIWAYSWPFSTWGIFSWAQQSSDRWTLEAFSSSHEVGLYSVLFQLGYAPMTMAMTLVMSFLGPILYQRSGDATDSNRNADVHSLAWRITLISLLVTLVAFVFAINLHEWIFKLLVASQYHSVSFLLPWVIMAGGLFSAGQMLALKLMSDMKSVIMLRAKIITSLLGLLLNIYLGATIGLKGIVGALVGFSAVYLLWMAWLAFRNTAAIIR